jgi:DNA-binding NtrC family response regulator
MKHSSTFADQPPMIFVVDDDKDLSKLVCRWLDLAGYQTLLSVSGEDCLARLNTAMPLCILLDLNLPNLSGVETLRKIKHHHPLLPVVMMTADSTVDSVVTAMQSGAYGYLSKPLDRTKLLTIVKTAVETNEAALRLRELEREKTTGGYEKIVGQSEPMRSLFKQLDSISTSDITVLIQGASGTGKELVARAIHATSSRQDSPFVALNCAAIPETLHESELFGYEKGAFTGASAPKTGKFEQAHTGTLFLDEVGEMSLSLQAKLLRVLQERSFQKLGGSKDIHVDFRLIAASHINLADAVKNNDFRDDLYYRLAVFELEIPTLAERKDDIPLISRKLLADFSTEANKPLSLSDEVLEFFQRYSFPGNVRELENALHRASVVCQAGLIRVQDLPKRIIDEVNNAGKPQIKPPSQSSSESSSVPQNLESVEKQAIEDAIRKANGNMSEAIRRLGIGRATFYRKLKKYGIN